jgi:hypothetical protein
MFNACIGKSELSAEENILSLETGSNGGVINFNDDEFRNLYFSPYCGDVIKGYEMGWTFSAKSREIRPIS